ncbi:glutamine--fructose-6-phosphate transaminase (isomerizing) [Maricaulis parjimensis]|uniref:glutamine--fructose-6-phosphate transaminase (isomerizing) n=1 Tax=Maricaulis parjimensis TaxID=144023 RepID=UPI00193A1D69|nr:glutamine--fructose-6-phosphate transaminase (isomerizing) [Maricaulis parjimensis]
MCGIVAGTGVKNVQTLLLEGLKRLEYRGYDSAGIALQGQDGRVHRWRAPGKVVGLEALLDPKIAGSTGIAHTRWATHGVPNEANAHPHQAGRVTLVHNGIIENFKTLRAELVAAGRTFSSHTDTEVVAALFDHLIQSGRPLREAWLATLSRLDGAFALAAMVEGEPGVVFGARRGAPLVAASGAGAGFLASDIMAISGKAESVVYLDEGDIVFVRPDNIEIVSATGKPVERQLVAAPRSITMAEKGNHRHFMQKEIYEQPEVVGRTLAAYIDTEDGKVSARNGVDFAQINRLLIVGCGTASYAGQVAEYWFEKLAGLPVKVDIASEFRYRDPAFLTGDAALFISQSGETADTLEALRLCKKAGLQTIALVNSPHSSMAREADVVVPTLAGPEIGVASTKAFTCQLTALAALAVQAGVQRGQLDDAAEESRVADLMALPGLMNSALATESKIDSLASELAHASIVLYLGRNELFPMALEGALKLKEISYIHAEGYAAGELKHGPIALIEDGVDVVVIAPHDALFSKTRSSIQEVRARGANVIAITDEVGARELEGEVNTVLSLPAVNGAMTAPIISAVAVQLLAYYIAVHKGTDVDQPRNLAKSVTVE